jgi:proline dehydrogenase
MNHKVSLPDFSDISIAFRDKSNAELKKTYWLFKAMNMPFLVNLGANLGMVALKLSLPFVHKMIKNTIFQQFCGGISLKESLPAIERLAKQHIFSVLDYGAEGKTKEEEFDITSQEAGRAIEFAAHSGFNPFISIKLTGLVQQEILEKVASEGELHASTLPAFQRFKNRVDRLCQAAALKKVSVFIDAEESWLQQPIDDLANAMMEKYNKEQAFIYNTFQMYRKDRLDFLKESFERSKEKGYVLGAKLVRGAYMEKEHNRAAALNVDSPVFDSKELTDHSFNEGIRFCLENYEEMVSCNASHNVQSVSLQVGEMASKGIPFNHPNLYFCQLMGMSDILTFNLANAGFNVGKYVVYGEIKEVVPYLIRRAEENSSVTGDMSRELSLVKAEMNRRNLL